MAELFVVNGICGGTVFFLPDVPTVLGRSPECHVQVADPWISSMHALFERRGEQLWVVDLDSRNGTFVDGERVHEAPVAPGSKLRFGKTGAEVRAQPEATEPQGILSDQRTIIRYIADLTAEPSRPAPAAAAAASLAERGASPAEPATTGLSEPRHETVRGPAVVTGVARRQIGILNEIGRALLGAAGVSDALERVLRVLGASLGAERSSVLLMDARGEMVPLAAVPADRPPRLSATVVQATLRSRAGILTLDAQQDLRFAQSQSVIAQGIHSCICAPIWADNRVLGVLLLERGFVDPFTADDLEVATLVGFQAALAVERARIEERAQATSAAREALARHLAPGVVAALLAAEAPELEPALRDGVAVVAAMTVGAGALAAQGTPGDAAARLRAVQRACADAAIAEGAAVDRRLDGSLLAVFGLPTAQADAAERARRCAVAWKEATARLEAGPGARLALRVGVATGQALLGDFGTPEAPELRAVGDAVETALRRAARAKPGEVSAED